MFPKKIKSSIEHRKNKYAKRGEEWELNISLDGGDTWPLTTFDYKPSIKKISQAVEIAIRAMEIYYRSIEVQPYIEITHEAGYWGGDEY